MLNLREEKKLWKKGFKIVACLDEAGRGCLAGPVVAAAVLIKNPKSEARNPKPCSITRYRSSTTGQAKFLYLTWDLFRISNLGFRILLKEIKDSKKLSPVKREKLYKILTQSDFIEWGIGRVSEKVIDKINILEATKLAMKKAINKLKSKITRKQSKARYGVTLYKAPLLYRGKYQKSKIDFLILDGNFKIDLPILQKSIIKADEKVFSCTAASIIAKVTRDRIMKKYHKKYPQYRFDKHKGYPTRYHLKTLKKYGPSDIHRKTFKPVLKINTKRKATTRN